MEGEGERLPKEGGGKGSMTKIIAAIVVIVVVVAAIGAALILMGGKETANKLPTANFSASSTLVQVAESVTFNASASADTDGSIVNYSWMFGDGGEVSVTTSELITHAYDYPGVYLVVLTVEDDKGATTTGWSTPLRVEVLNPVPEAPDNDTLPFALAAASDGVIQNNTVISFDGNSSGAYTMLWDNDSKVWYLAFGPENLDEVEWHFGDGSAVVSGNISVAGFVSHTYTGNGNIYASYAVVTGIHSTVQRYYNTVVVLPLGGTGAAVKNPNTFTTTEFGEPQSLDPAWDYESAGGEILQNVYETLVTYDHESTSDMVPVLATEVPTVANGGVSPDLKNYTYHLRAGVKFHYTAGTMTAEDVAYSLKRVLIMNDPEGPGFMLGGYMIPGWRPGNITYTAIGPIDDAIEVVDSMTLTLHLITPMPFFNQIMAYTVASIVPKAFVEANGGVVPLERNEFMNRNCDGTGPFKLIEWAPNQHIIMQRFDDYWQQEKAKLEFVIIKKANDYGTRLMLLKSGQADAAVMPISHRADMENNADIVLSLKPTLSVLFMYMTADIEPGTIDIGNIPLTFFNDINVRKAFCYAFNYDEFIRTQTLGTALRANGPIVQGLMAYGNTQFYDPTIPMYDFNLTKAADYLKIAQDPRHPGQTYAETGFTLNLFYNAGNLGRQAAGLMIQDGFTAMSKNATLGITGTFTVTVNALDWPTFLNARTARNLPCSIIAWGADYPDPDDFAYPLLHNDGSFPYFSGQYNDTLSAMIEDAAKELNQTKRIPMYSNISLAAYDNAYLMYLDQPTAFFSLRSWVHGWFYNPMHSLYLYYEMYKA
ncbi:MAG: ABC transporter substrate-binding protein [Methanomassiliicoccales archaeon]|nr:ABC transporter substrate-binding protein [Methanomassiliicoccales archaeon]